MIRELKTLLAVARQGSFAAAGDSIGLTQAAVSAQMQRLEAALGFALFERTGRSATLNAAGQRTLAQAQELIALYERLGTGQPAEPGATRLKVGAIASVQRLRLPQAVAQLRAERPDCHVHVVPGVSIDLLNRVDAGDIEMAAIIRPSFALQSELHWTPLAREPFRLLVPRRVRGDDWRAILAAQPFVRYDRASFGGRQVERFLRASRIAVHEACELDELEALVRLVAAGVGVALAPQTDAHPRWPAGVRAIDLGTHTFHREIGLVHRAMSGRSESARAFAHELAGVYRSGS